MNLNKQLPCTSIDGNFINFDFNNSVQTLPRKIFEPYNSLFFTQTCTKN